MKSPEQFAQAPKEILSREVKVAQQVLVTTVLDQRRVDKEELSALYARRWNIELDLRNLKTTTGLDVLRCQMPQTNEKADVGASAGSRRGPDHLGSHPRNDMTQRQRAGQRFCHSTVNVLERHADSPDHQPCDAGPKTVSPPPPVISANKGQLVCR